MSHNLRCESCQKVLTGAVHWTEDDVPLCDDCWNEFVADAEQAREGPKEEK